MFSRRLTMLVLAAAFAASSSIALLQNAGPALADRDANTRLAQQQRRDRDDWNRKHHKQHANPRVHANNGHHYGQQKHHDRDHR
jgi:hypothetical protein